MLRKWRLKFHRWRLYSAYSEMIRRRDGLDGFTNYLMVLQEMEEDDLIEIEDGGIEWQWPGDDA